MRTTHPTLLLTLSLLAAAPLSAQRPPCFPCAGLAGEDPVALAAALATAGPIAENERIYLRFDLALDQPAALDPLLAAAADAGATPWARLHFAAPAPITANVAALDLELEVAASVAAALGPRAHIQVEWGALDPADPERVRDYAFLLKRASVAVAGAAAEARVITAALPAGETTLRELYQHDVAAYLEGIAVHPGSPADLEATAATLLELDPGRPLVLDSLPFPSTAPAQLLVDAARAAASGIAVIFFDQAAADSVALGPAVRLARELAGDVSLDPASSPGGAPSWAFVRGEDLSLRVIVDSAAAGESLALAFTDPTLRGLARIDLTTGERQAEYGVSRRADGFTAALESPGPALLLSLERPTAAELEGIEERVEVQTERHLPVDEILRRLQAFEDAQARRLDHYSAINALSLRFQGGGAGAVETTFEGPFFFQRGQGFDWAWESLYLNGVKWRREKLPEIPLIQPEKAATLPLEITFTKEYTYRLRGTDLIEGRDCWVIDFAPADPTVGAEKRLFQGTVWVDRELFARVRTRALQLGLDGEVLSNEETFTFSPVDDSGNPAAWSADSYFLPLLVTGQQILNVLNSAVVVEKEQRLSAISINGANFAERREVVLSSNATMVRDTDEGLKYLVKNEDGTREVKDGFDATKTFLIGGTFYDESLDFPLPLAGINILSLDFRGKGQQANIFFAGALLVANFADPQLGETKFDAGVDLFGVAIPFSDSFTRNGVEQPDEEVGVLPATIAFNLGHPIGNFFRIGATARAAWRNSQQTDDTADDFVLPADHFDLSLGLEGRYARSGYRVTVEGALHQRSDWEPWGFAEQRAAFDPDTEEYQTYGITAAKTWSLGGFRRLGLELGWVGGDNLDRFSKYDFGFFGDTRVRGFAGDTVRAEKASLAKVNFGWTLGEILRIDLGVDAAWATDPEAGLDNELLLGAGISGTVPGPWGTFVQADLSMAVDGPDDGFVAYLVFLKLFD